MQTKILQAFHYNLILIIPTNYSTILKKNPSQNINYFTVSGKLHFELNNKNEKNLHNSSILRDTFSTLD